MSEKVGATEKDRWLGIEAKMMAIDFYHDLDQPEEVVAGEVSSSLFLQSDEAIVRGHGLYRRQKEGDAYGPTYTHLLSMKDGRCFYARPIFKPEEGEPMNDRGKKEAMTLKRPGMDCLAKLDPSPPKAEKCDHKQGRWAVELEDGKLYGFDPATQFQKDAWLGEQKDEKEAMARLRWICFECGTVQQP